MVLVWAGSVKHLIEFDNVGVGLIAQEFVASAIKAEDETILLCPVLGDTVHIRGCHIVRLRKKMWSSIGSLVEEQER